MKSYACLAITIFLIAGCASTPAPQALVETPAAKPAQSAAEPGPPPSGTWSGDYGPNSAQRESIRVELRWEGTELRGTVLSGFRSMDLTKASFKPETGAITMEFDAQGNNNQTVHYLIEGKIEGDRMTGTWKHAAAGGDFAVEKQ